MIFLARLKIPPSRGSSLAPETRIAAFRAADASHARELALRKMGDDGELPADTPILLVELNDDGPHGKLWSLEYRADLPRKRKI
jgi:hypothetical protein